MSETNNEASSNRGGGNQAGGPSKPLKQWPKLGPVVLKSALKAEPGDTFETLLSKVRPQVDETQAKRLDDWLATHTQWKQISAERMAEAFSKIDRFLFRVGTTHQPAKPA